MTKYAFEPIRFRDYLIIIIPGRNQLIPLPDHFQSFLFVFSLHFLFLWDVAVVHSVMTCWFFETRKISKHKFALLLLQFYWPVSIVFKILLFCNEFMSYSNVHFFANDSVGVTNYLFSDSSHDHFTLLMQCLIL